MKLKIIVGSTRPSRKGIFVAEWFEEFAKAHSEFEIELLDLKEIQLPFLDEDAHPRLKQYKHTHTLNWSQKIEEGDAYVLVTPEYNHSYPATVKNALDCLSQEWAEKPLAFVSYGGVSGGTRSVNDLKAPVATLNMMPILEAVNIPFFTNFIQDERFIPNEIIEQSAEMMLKKLYQWAKALKGMRTAALNPELQ